MNSRQFNWLSVSALAATVFCAAIALLPPPARSKVHPQRINRVNNVASTSLKFPCITLPTTNAPSAK